MPAYVYHLRFELYPHPDVATPPPSAPIAASQKWIPPAETDIFATDLPAHQTATWRLSKHAHRRSKTAVSSSANPPPQTQRRPSLRERRLTHTATNIPGHSRNGPAPRHDKDLTGRSSFKRPVVRDWRFGTVSIESIDMKHRDPGVAGRVRESSTSHGEDVEGASVGLATKGRYVPSNPKNTEVGWGVVHLYRDVRETPTLDDDDVSSSASSGSNTGGRSEQEDFNEEQCTTLCILAVPSYMTPSDLLGYVGEKTREDVSHFRLVRTGRANKYMVLVKFRDAKKARKWRKEWNGKLFNSMEPENCHVVFVKSIEFRPSEKNIDPSSFPNMTNDPFTPAGCSQPTAPLPPTSSAVESASLVSSLSTKPLAPPTPSLVELPTCPVCLERMDETTGLLTILCQHVFHCACLEKWRGSGCPVCRYTQNDALIGRSQARDGEAPENECSVCGSASNLWICLICGNIGCGRYDSAHAFAHWETTSHSYAMDVATQHVWDYAGDGYVHRLIQNKADGKLVDLPAAYHQGHDNATMTGFGPDTVPREKLDAMGAEYAYLLTSQLDSQRAYFEEQVERAVDKAATAAAEASSAASSASKLALRVDMLTVDRDESRAMIASLEKDVQRASHRAEKADGLARKLGKEWREEKTMNEALMQRIEFLDGRVKELGERGEALEAEKTELEEQNRDLSFFISGGAKLREAGVGEDVVEGTVEVPSGGQGTGKGKKAKKKK